MKTIKLLASKKSNYVCYLIIDTITNKESGEVKENVYHLALASDTTPDGIKKIFNFAKEFGIFQNSEVVGIKSVYLDEEKKQKILTL